jgi:hypothetical protein
MLRVIQAPSRPSKPRVVLLMPVAMSMALAPGRSPTQSIEGRSRASMPCGRERNFRTKSQADPYPLTRRPRSAPHTISQARSFGPDKPARRFAISACSPLPTSRRKTPSRLFQRTGLPARQIGLIVVGRNPARRLLRWLAFRGSPPAIAVCRTCAITGRSARARP